MSNEKNAKPTSIIAHVFWIGLFGGLFLSIIGYIANLFHFTDIHLNVILDPWAVGDWKKEWQGTLISIILFCMLSVGAAYIYYALMKKFKGILSGIIYGMLIFFLVFFVFNPLFPGIGGIDEISRDTIITSICLYVLYGLFIGYSISYQYEFHQSAKNDAAT